MRIAAPLQDHGVVRQLLAQMDHHRAELTSPGCGVSTSLHSRYSACAARVIGCTDGWLAPGGGERAPSARARR